MALRVSAQFDTGQRCKSRMLLVTWPIGGVARGSPFRYSLRHSLAFDSEIDMPFFDSGFTMSAGNDADRLCLKFGGTQSFDGFSYEVSKGNSPTRNKWVLVGNGTGFGG